MKHAGAGMRGTPSRRGACERNIINDTIDTMHDTIDMMRDTMGNVRQGRGFRITKCCTSVLHLWAFCLLLLCVGHE